ncbi:MAG: hypothetical protein U0521_01410 [Anaerolineae bacterium]
MGNITGVHDNPGGLQAAPEIEHASRDQATHLIGLAVILILGAALRFVNLDISEFWYDEATLSTLAQNMAAGKALPLLGIPSSANIPNPPAGVYLSTVRIYSQKIRWSRSGSSPR